MTKRNWKKLLHLLLGIAGLGGSLSVIFYFMTSNSFSLPPLHFTIFIFALIVIEILSRSLRLKRLLSYSQLSLPLWESIKINLLGDVFASITPARVGGEISRASFLRKYCNGLKMASFKLVAENANDYISLFFLVALFGSYLLFTSTEALMQKNILTALLVFVFIIASLIGVLFILIRKKILPRHFSHFSYRPELLFYTSIHHIIRIGILPLILAYFSPSLFDAATFAWSFFFIYAFNLLPLPSGGGTIELSFTHIFDNALGNNLATALIWWRFFSHYSYIILGSAFLLRDLFKKIGTHEKET